MERHIHLIPLFPMKMIRNILILCIIFSLTGGLKDPMFAQKITYNYLIDTSNIDTKQIMNLFESYIHSKPDSLYDNPYWNSDEKHQYKHFDFLESEFQPSLYMGFPVHVLSIKLKNGLYEIKAQFSYCQSDGTPYVLCIANYYAMKENGLYKLYNALPINRKNWLHTKICQIDFYYPPYHVFDTLKAQALNDFANDLCNNLNVKVIPFEYYMADDFDEIQNLRGIDYYIGMGGEVKPTGRSNNYDKVYAGGMDENYFHEVFHILIDPHYPDKHQWISEGMATWLGGSRGESLQWHIIRTDEYLKKHPEINLNDLLTLKTIDKYTDYRYVLGGIIVKKIYEKGGWNSIIAFMKTGKSDENYYKAIETYLGVKKKDLNTYLRKELETSSKQ